MMMMTLYNGLSGVKVYEGGLQSVADNMANVNTYGYKHTRANFDDLLYQQMGLGTNLETGGAGARQLGTGASFSAQNIMNQGDFEKTENVTDLAVNGRGFFTVRDAAANETFYTRYGGFVVDMDGYMVMPTGERLQGFQVNSETGAVAGAGLIDLQLPINTETPAVATSLIEKVINLNAEDQDTHTQDVDIDPSDTSTYNYSSGLEVYDAEGNAHQVHVFYQNLESYTGSSPTGSSSVWKAAVFENRDGTLVPNPPDSSGAAQNYFYMHFDTDGHLVGTSGLGTPRGESRVIDGAVVSSSGSEVSNRAGETFSYRGDGSAQTFISTLSIDLGNAWGGTDTITLQSGGAALVPAYSAAAHATGADLAAAINADSATTGVWANYIASSDTITLYSSGGQAVEAVSSDSAITVSGNTMTDVENAIDNGRSATGALHLSGPLDGGEQVTINGTTLTLSAGDDASDVAAAINNDATLGSQVTASVVGSSVFIRADNNGSGANSWGLSASSDPDGDITASGASLAGGMDSSSTTQVEASVGAYSSGGSSGVALTLSRDDLGAAATVSVTGSTLGSSLATPLDFAQTTQTQAPSAGPTSASTGGQVGFNFSFLNSEGNPVSQNITMDYDPTSTADIYTGSTHSAGSSEITFLDQNGSPGGSLDSLEIADNGVIWGNYTDGQHLALGAVALTTFTAAEALEREGDNLWRATAAVGNIVVGSPEDADAGLGKLLSNTLEQSTVDVSQEMVNMINYQRSYQANSKSIQAGDEVLKTAINLIG